MVFTSSENPVLKKSDISNRKNSCLPPGGFLFSLETEPFFFFFLMTDTKSQRRSVLKVRKVIPKEKK